MKKLLYLCVAVCMAFTTASVFAATDMTGTWVGQMKSPDGNGFQLSFTFKQDGTALTGTVQSPQGDPLPISNGKVDGDKFSFDVSFNGMTINHSGTVTGDEIKMTTKSSSGDFPGGELTLTRSKGASGTSGTPEAPKQP